MPAPPAVEAVTALIRDAFAATPNPGDHELVADQSGRDPECAEVAAAFRGLRWQDAPLDLLRRYADALPLFRPGAFRYYLPAYLLATIRSYYDVDTMRDALAFNLSPPGTAPAWQADHFRARASLFTDAERKAVASFLEVMAEYDRDDWGAQGLTPPDDRWSSALEFWGQGSRAG
jgi:hypothetical protein